MGIPGNNGLSMMEGHIILADFRSFIMRNFDLSPLYRSAIGFDRLLIC
jgi:molecular chaperone IbpA